MGYSRKKIMQKQNFISKNQYKQTVQLIKKVFSFGQSNIQEYNAQKDFRNLENNNHQFQKNQSFQSILCYNNQSDFMHSFSGFTRQTNQVLFLLVNEKLNFQCLEQNKKLYQLKNLRILFINAKGQLLHVLSNLQQQNIYKLNKLLTKHFQRLNSIFIYDNSNKNISELLIEKLPKKKYKIVYMTPFSLQQAFLSKRAYFTSSQRFKTWKMDRRETNNQNFCYQNFKKEDQQNGILQFYMQKLLRYYRIHELIVSQMWKFNKYSLQALINNEWINKVFSWHFNLISGIENNFKTSLDYDSAIFQIYSKREKIFEALLDQINQQKLNYKIQSHCYPDIFQLSKRCFVCKYSKPKYGCSHCSKKFKIEINLCIQKCFKMFHKNIPKYLKKKFKPANLNKLSNLQKQIQFQAINDQNDVKKSEKSSNNEKIFPRQKQKGKILQNRMSKYKKIKKQVQKMQRKLKGCLPIRNINQVELYNFSKIIEMQNDDVQ